MKVGDLVWVYISDGKHWWDLKEGNIKRYVHPAIILAMDDLVVTVRSSDVNVSPNRMMVYRNQVKELTVGELMLYKLEN